MSTCQAFPTKTKAQAIEGFCDEFPGFCEVSPSGVESVPSDVEREILLDDVSTNDYNDCDGGFDFELVCPTACGQPESTVSATYRVVADAFGGGEECPYHDGFVMDRTCPATPACAVDCQGGNWNQYSSGLPDCPTNCSYPGETFSRQWVNATPATGGGKECPSSETKTCNAAMTCSDMVINTYQLNRALLTFTPEGLPDPSDEASSKWSVVASGWSLVNVGGKDAWQWTSPYDYYRKYKLNSYVLDVNHRYKSSWFPKVFRMVGVSDRGEDVIHEFDLESAGKIPYNFMYNNEGETVYQTSGYSSTLEYVDTTGFADYEMRVSCGTEASKLKFRQLKFQMFSIDGRTDCQVGLDCDTYYELQCDVQTV